DPTTSADDEIPTYGINDAGQVVGSYVAVHNYPGGSAWDSDAGFVLTIRPDNDFDGNGTSDLIFQNSLDGKVFEWQLNGTTVTGSGFVGNNTDPSWHVVATGDFNGDGYSDLIWQNSTSGQVFEWQLLGTAIPIANFVGNNNDPSWRVVGSGD